MVGVYQYDGLPWYGRTAERTSSRTHGSVAHPTAYETSQALAAA